VKLRRWLSDPPEWWLAALMATSLLAVVGAIVYGVVMQRCP
jgi:hypothetical protein